MNQYCHLISTPEQIKSDFSTRLALTHQLADDEKIYCGLSQLTIPTPKNYTFVKPVSDEHPLEFAIHIPFLTEAKFVKLELPSANYDPVSICAKLNGLMKESFGRQFTQELCRFVYNEDTERTEIFLNGEGSKKERRTTLIIFSGLAVPLGLTNDISSSADFIFGSPTELLPGRVPIHSTHAIASNESLLYGHLRVIFVHLSIVESQVSGKDERESD